MTDLFAPTYYDLVACVQREIAMRKSVYPRWVSNGRMTRDKADREILMMGGRAQAPRAYRVRPRRGGAMSRPLALGRATARHREAAA